MKSKVSVVGSLNYDIFIKSNRRAKKGETHTVQGVNFASGGKGINQAIQISKLGIETKFFGCLGEDIFGDYILDKISIKNLDINSIKRVNDSTGLGIVNLLNDGSVYADIYPGANYRVDINYLKENLDLILDSEYLLIQFELPLESTEFLIEKAYEKKCKIIFNAAPAKEISDNYLKKVNTLILNETEAEFYTGESFDTIELAKKNGKALKDRLGIECLIITLGEKGSILFSNEVEKINTYKPNKVMDTTGAGDSYIGAFLYAIIMGHDLYQACTFASLVASKTVEKIGAQASMPSIDEVKSDSRSKTILHFGKD